MPNKCSQSKCYCKEPETCSALQQYKKLVYCSATDCLWNTNLKHKKLIKYHKDWKPLGEKDGFVGVCGRAEIGLSPDTTYTYHGKYHIVKCSCYSKKIIGGHIDFAKMLKGDGTPYGGNIPDPISGDTAYHTSARKRGEDK